MMFSSKTLKAMIVLASIQSNGMFSPSEAKSLRGGTKIGDRNLGSCWRVLRSGEPCEPDDRKLSWGSYGQNAGNEPSTGKNDRQLKDCYKFCEDSDCDYECDRQLLQGLVSESEPSSNLDRNLSDLEKIHMYPYNDEDNDRSLKHIGPDYVTPNEHSARFLNMYPYNNEGNDRGMKQNGPDYAHDEDRALKHIGPDTANTDDHSLRGLSKLNIHDIYDDDRKLLQEGQIVGTDEQYNERELLQEGHIVGTDEKYEDRKAYRLAGSVRANHAGRCRGDRRAGLPGAGEQPA